MRIIIIMMWMTTVMYNGEDDAATRDFRRMGERVESRFIFFLLLLFFIFYALNLQWTNYFVRSSLIERIVDSACLQSIAPHPHFVTRYSIPYLYLTRNSTRSSHTHYTHRYARSHAHTLVEAVFINISLRSFAHARIFSIHIYWFAHASDFRIFLTLLPSSIPLSVSPRARIHPRLLSQYILHVYLYVFIIFSLMYTWIRAVSRLKERHPPLLCLYIYICICIYV